MEFDYNGRIARLKAITGVDAVAIIPGANMAYFTGVHMHASERPAIAIFSDTGRAVIVPELEVPMWSSRPGLKLQLFSWRDEEGFAGAFAAAVKALKLDTAVLGVDGQTMRVFELYALQASGVHQIKDVGVDLLHIRVIKTTAEVEAMREAIRLSEQALHRVMEWVQPGKTEREIAAELDRILMEAGSQGYAFSTLVQTGPNSAIPHNSVSDRALQEGEFLLIDFGGIRHGYPADITRTFCLGQPSDDMRQIYEAVLAANRAGVAACKPGVTAGEIDRVTRAVIEEAGYGEYFIHRTGHGLGLETHERPNITAGNAVTLEPGMVFTVEPGVYVPGLGGVRIEDDVHITESGADVLTVYPRTLPVTR
jgi:Xaa-Pro dipeptidase